MPGNAEPPVASTGRQLYDKSYLNRFGSQKRFLCSTQNFVYIREFMPLFGCLILIAIYSMSLGRSTKMHRSTKITRRDIFNGIKHIAIRDQIKNCSASKKSLSHDWARCPNMGQFFGFKKTDFSKTTTNMMAFSITGRIKLTELFIFCIGTYCQYSLISAE